MAILLKPLRCPYCSEPMDKRLLRREGLLQDFLQSKKFPCPHCKNWVVFPEKADTMASMGIFVAVILAPLFHFWDINLMDTRYLFALGVSIFIVGSFTQKLDKAGKASPSDNADKPSDIQDIKREG